MKKQTKTIVESEATTREKILTAARKEFIENGLRGARMQEIADRAGINKALLHYHFRDKENLYSEALQSVISSLSGSVSNAFGNETQKKSVEDSLLILVNTYMDILENNPDFVGLTLRELSDGGAHLEPILRGVAPLIQKIASTMKEKFAQANPKVKAPNLAIPHTMLSMMSLVWGTYLLKPLYTNFFTFAGYEKVLQQNFIPERKRHIAALLHSATLPMENKHE